MSRRGRRGLVGMLLSIVVAVVIVIAIFSVYNQVTVAANAAQTAVFVRQLVPQITSAYGGKYTGLNNPSAVSSGFIPDNWRDGNAIRSPSGARVTIGPLDSGRNFRITFHFGVPVQTCKAVLSALKSDQRFYTLRVGGTSTPRSDVDTPAKINTACAGFGHGDFEPRFR